MKLIEALSILSKSSPFAVSTDRISKHILSDYKSHIYVKTQIETDFLESLRKLNSGQIIFLCGSSGDGKSEILTHHSDDWKSKVDFHLDATHSFNPDQTAINALDNRFRQNKETGRPLVVGINTGMLGNYAEEGCEEHLDIITAIKSFLARKKQKISDQYVFLDFEDYPKFSFSEQGNTSEFALKLIQRLTEQDLANPFYALHQNQLAKNGQDHITTNFSLLAIPSVQQTVVDLLLKARLVKDRFLTARALLDFIFQILAKEGYLFDNLFSGGDNELLQHIQTFDPSNLHTRTVDEFVLQYGLGIEDNQFCEFRKKLNSLGIFDVKSASSFLRIFYVLNGDKELCNEFVETIQNEFTNNLIESYVYIWMLHRDFNGSSKMRKELSCFYKETFITALHRYCNRHAPLLDKDEYLVSEHNGYKTTVSLEVKPDFSSIQDNVLKKIGEFNAYVEVNGQLLKPMPISVKLFELLVKIGQGYRPNKHDKNAVLLLDEALEQILTVAKQKDTLFILKDDRRYKVVREESDYFEVSGMH